MVSHSIPPKVGDYTVLPILLPSLQVHSQTSASVHYLYLCRHLRKPTANPLYQLPEGRSIFLINLPIDATSLLVRGLIGSLGGRVEEVRFGKSIEVPSYEEEHEENGERGIEVVVPAKKLTAKGANFPHQWDRELLKSGGTAYVVFAEIEGLEKVFKSIATLREKSPDKPIRQWGVGVAEGRSDPELGLQRYLKHYELSHPSHMELQHITDLYVNHFNAQTHAQTLSLRRLATQPDEDGFVTVTRASSSRSGFSTISNPEDYEGGLTTKKRKSKSEGLEDFYRFQKIEGQRKKLEELKRKWEEDKGRVERMKNRGGGFKPY